MGRATRRAGLIASVADQAVSGGTNLLFSVAAARALSPQGFGIIGVVSLVYLITVSALRALIAEPLLIAEDEDGDGAASSAWVLGIWAGAGIAVTGLLVGQDLGRALLALGVAFPLLAIQDVARYISYHRQQPRAALASDIIWLAVFVGAAVVLEARATPTPATMVATWAGAGATAGAAVILTGRVGRRRPRLTWLRTSWARSWRYLGSFAATFGAAYSSSLVLGATAGTTAVGELRGAQLLFSPLTMAYAAASNVLTVRIARTKRDHAALRRQLAAVSCVMSAGAAALTVLSLTLPDSIGVQVLGDSWEGSRDLIAAAGLQALGIGLWTGAKIGMTGLRHIAEGLRLDAALAPALVVAPVTGGLLGGAEAFLWALAACHLVIATIWWRALTVRLSRSSTR